MKIDGKVKSKLTKAKEKSNYMKMARKEKQNDEGMLKLVVAGVFSVIIGGLISVWKIFSDDK